MLRPALVFVLCLASDGSSYYALFLTYSCVFVCVCARSRVCLSVQPVAKANSPADAKSSYVTMVDSLQSWASAEGKT